MPIGITFGRYDRAAGEFVPMPLEKSLPLILKEVERMKSWQSVGDQH